MSKNYFPTDVYHNPTEIRTGYGKRVKFSDILLHNRLIYLLFLTLYFFLKSCNQRLLISNLLIHKSLNPTSL